MILLHKWSIMKLGHLSIRATLWHTCGEGLIESGEATPVELVSRS